MKGNTQLAPGSAPLTVVQLCSTAEVVLVVGAVVGVVAAVGVDGSAEVVLGVVAAVGVDGSPVHSCFGIHGP